MSSPFSFRKTSARGYEVIAKSDLSILGVVVRTTPDHATFTARWNATTVDGDYLGAGYTSRERAAAALAERAELVGTPAVPAPTLPEAATVRTWNLHMVNEGTSGAPRIAHQIRHRDTGDVLGTVRQEDAYHGLYGATDSTGALRVTGELGRMDAARKLIDLVAEDDDRDGTTGPTPGSFHDPRVTCCGRDAADCDCPEDGAETETCERCPATFDPDQAGTSPDAGLCAACTANNDARVIL